MTATQNSDVPKGMIWSRSADKYVPIWQVKILTSAELKGNTGENGETHCVWLDNLKNPLSGGWAWFRTSEEANEYAAKLQAAITDMTEEQ